MGHMSSLTYSARVPERKVYAKAETGEAELTIRQMAQLYAVSPRTLRFYEHRGLLNPAREGNVRSYSAADRVRLELILQGKKLGFTLAEIHDLIGKGVSDSPDLEERLQPIQILNQIDFLERQRDEIDNAIQRLRATHDNLSQGAVA